MTYKISIIQGDGVGPELTESALTILDKINDNLDVSIDKIMLPAGDSALVQYGKALPNSTLDKIKASDACIKAPVGESAKDVIVLLRRKLDLYANIRPAKSYAAVPSLSNNTDLVIVRENTEDLYTGAEFNLDDAAVALRIITYPASKRIAKYAFWMAQNRNKKVTCVHKSNVLKKTDGIFIQACTDVSKDYPDIVFEQMYVDACAMNLIRKPESFDVIVTTNMFGDILSDESSQMVGGLGLAPAANIGDDFALFEPVHGAAFDIAGKQIVNPSSMLLSIKMMLEWFGAKNNDSNATQAALKLESAILNTINSGIKTADLGGTSTSVQFTTKVAKQLN